MKCFKCGNDATAKITEKMSDSVTETKYTCSKCFFEDLTVMSDCDNEVK